MLSLHYSKAVVVSLELSKRQGYILGQMRKWPKVRYYQQRAPSKGCLGDDESPWKRETDGAEAGRLIACLLMSLFEISSRSSKFLCSAVCNLFRLANSLVRSLETEEWIRVNKYSSRPQMLIGFCIHTQLQSEQR